MSDFTGEEFEFAVGSLQGLRSWNMDALGRLHGVTHREVWTPGENVSICKQTIEVPCPNKVAPKDHLPKLTEAAVRSKPKKRRRRGGPIPEPLAPWERDLLEGRSTSVRCSEPTCHLGRHIVPTGHRFDPACGCGFWAYDEASFTPVGEIVGVINAYGKTTIGTKGFRAEKASILALSRTKSDGKPLTRSALLRLASLYPDVQFYDGLDALIDAHDGVLKQWGDVGEDFWLRPVRAKEDELRAGALGSLRHQWYTSLSPSYRSIGGGA